MNSYQISYTDEALQDLRDIFDYISAELKSPGVAVAQVRRIRDEVRSLNIFPNRYKAVDWKPWMTKGMRLMPVDNFVVFYVVAEEISAVQIVCIIYGKRDIPNIVNTLESEKFSHINFGFMPIKTTSNRPS